MSLVLVWVGVWLATIVAFVGAVWWDSARQCRRGRHTWAWEFGRWTCYRCGRPDVQAHAEAAR